MLTTNLVGHMGEFYEVFRTLLVELGHEDRLPILDAHINHRATTDSVSDLLASSGFTVDDVVTRSFRMRFADGSSLLHHHFIRFGFVPDWKAVTPSDSMEAIFKALEKKLKSYAAEHGELALTIPMACVVARKS